MKTSKAKSGKTTKKAPPKKKPAKPAPKPKWFPSQQWRSESTRAAAADAANPQDSPSPTGGSTTKCKGGKYKKSGPLKMRGGGVRILHVTPQFMGQMGEPGAIGLTVLDPQPRLGSVQIVCDRNTKTWRASIVGCVYGVRILLVTTPVLSNEGLDGADCATLHQILAGLQDLIASSPNYTPAGLLAMPPGFVENHEQVHALMLVSAISARYTTLVASIEGLSAECKKDSDTGPTRAMQRAINRAINRFNNGVRLDNDRIRNHRPLQPFKDAAIQSVTDWIDTVEDLIHLKCP